jgi:hypothetical protein
MNEQKNLNESKNRNTVSFNFNQKNLQPKDLKESKEDSDKFNYSLISNGIRTMETNENEFSFDDIRGKYFK